MLTTDKVNILQRFGNADQQDLASDWLDLHAALHDAMKAIHYLEAQQAMPDDGWKHLLNEANKLGYR